MTALSRTFRHALVVARVGLTWSRLPRTATLGFFPAVLAANWLSLQGDPFGLFFVGFWGAWCSTTWLLLPNPTPPTMPLSRTEAAFGTYLGGLLLQGASLLAWAGACLPLLASVGSRSLAIDSETLGEWAILTAAGMLAFPLLALGLQLRPVARPVSANPDQWHGTPGMWPALFWYPSLLALAWSGLPPAAAVLLHGIWGVAIGRWTPIDPEDASDATPAAPRAPTIRSPVHLASPLTPAWRTHVVRMAAGVVRGFSFAAFLGSLNLLFVWLDEPEKTAFFWELLVQWPGGALVVAAVVGLSMTWAGSRFSPFWGGIPGPQSHPEAWTRHLPLAPRQHLWHELLPIATGLVVVGGVALTTAFAYPKYGWLAAPAYAVAVAFAVHSIGAGARHTLGQRPPSVHSRAFAWNLLHDGLVWGLGLASVVWMTLQSDFDPVFLLVPTGIILVAIGSAVVSWARLYRRLGA
ncbi:MAG: hypothetical protein AAF211_12045 [Myxococcota bacterium]